MQYYAALLTICFGLLLGFCDDVLDIPHKYKYVIPIWQIKGYDLRFSKKKNYQLKGVIMTVSKEEWLVTLNMELAMMKRNNESQLKKLTSLFQQSERQPRVVNPIRRE